MEDEKTPFYNLVGRDALGHNVSPHNCSACEFLVDDDSVCLYSVHPLFNFQPGVVEQGEVVGKRCAPGSCNCSCPLGSVLDRG